MLLLCRFCVAFSVLPVNPDNGDEDDGDLSEMSFVIYSLRGFLMCLVWFASPYLLDVIFTRYTQMDIYTCMCVWTYVGM